MKKRGPQPPPHEHHHSHSTVKVVDALSNGAAWTKKQIHHHTKVPLSTIHRQLRDLTEHGLLAVAPNSPSHSYRFELQFMQVDGYTVEQFEERRYYFCMGLLDAAIQFEDQKTYDRIFDLLDRTKAMDY